MKKTTFLKRIVIAMLLCIVGIVSSWAATPYTMSSGDYTEGFADIANWTDNFAAGTGASRWAAVAINASGTLGDGVKTTLSTATFKTTTSGGVQKGSANIYLLSTSTANSCAIDLLLDFTGRNAGTISFDVATVFNSTGNRDSKLKLFYSTDGTTFTELTGTNLPFTARNNVALSSSVSAIALPSAFNNCSTARLRFYEYSTALGGTSPTGSQPKISLDNVTVTSIPSTPVPAVTAGTPTGTVGTPFTYQIVATNTPTSYALSSGTLPDGLTLNTTTGEIAGTPTAAGTPSVTVTATNTGGTSVAATLSFTIVNPAGQAQTITFGALSGKTYGDATFDLGATASSGLAVSYASSNTAVATVSGSTVTIVGAGTTDITASQAGNGTYNPATSVVQSLTVAPIMLTIADIAVTPKVYTGTNAATITGSLVGVINSDDVTFVGAGTFADVNVGNSISVTSNCSLSGTKAMNYTLIPISGLLGNITIAPQTITFGALASKSISDVKFKLTGTASSGLSVSYISSNLSVATVVNDSLFIVGVGSTTITASQVGNGNYSAATPVAQSLTVTGAPIVAWQFGNPASLGSEATFNATTNHENLATTTLSRGSGITATALGRAFSSNAWDNAGTKATAESGNEYYEFAVTPKPGYKLSLTSLDATIRRSGATAPNTYIWKYSTDGTLFNEIGTEVSYTGTTEGVSQPQIDLLGIVALQNVSSSTTITFRLYAWGGTSTTSTFAFGRYATSVTTNSLSVGGFVDAATAIRLLVAGSSIVVSNRSVRISGAFEYSIFNTQGVRVANSKVGNDTANVTLFPGVYIVQAGGKTQKIVIK